MGALINMFLEGEEVLHLPVIVDAAESSPVAAQEAAHRIRKFLSKDNFQRAYVQYNAIMLVRILADNPGKSFTKNIDGKFVATVKELLRDGRDMSVQQILRETLESFEMQKSDDETLAPLREMWKKEKQKLENWRSVCRNFYINVKSLTFTFSPPPEPSTRHHRRHQMLTSKTISLEIINHTVCRRHMSWLNGSRKPGLPANFSFRLCSRPRPRTSLETSLSKNLLNDVNPPRDLSKDIFIPIIHRPMRTLSLRSSKPTISFRRPSPDTNALFCKRDA